MLLRELITDQTNFFFYLESIMTDFVFSLLGTLNVQHYAYSCPEQSPLY